MAQSLSRVVRIDALPKDGQTFELAANEEERRELAALYKIPSIEALTASLTVKRASRGGARVKGTVHGELTQLCVVSLDPFPTTIDEEIDVRFAAVDHGKAPRVGEVEEFSIADEDEPDPLVDGRIDLGALAAEFFALAIDPYPRQPGVVFEGEKQPEAIVSPFSALARRSGE